MPDPFWTSRPLIARCVAILVTAISAGLLEAGARKMQEERLQSMELEQLIEDTRQRYEHTVSYGATVIVCVVVFGLIVVVYELLTRCINRGLGKFSHTDVHHQPVAGNQRDPFWTSRPRIARCMAILVIAPSLGLLWAYAGKRWQERVKSMSTEQFAEYARHQNENLSGYGETVIFILFVFGFLVVCYELLTRWIDRGLEKISNNSTP